MIKLIKSSFYNEAETKKALAKFIISQDIFSMNVECRKFEKAFAAKQGRKHAVLVTSGSTANLLLIQALLNSGLLKKGDKIGFSALTWPTNVMPLIQLGLIPVPIDCELRTLNMSPRLLADNIDGLKALFITNTLGFSDDLAKIADVCEDNDVLLLEDNCEALGSVYKQKLLGNFGLGSTFSFFVGHHISTIEGGMVCTDDDDLYEQLLISHTHGWDRNLSPASQKKLRNQNNVSDFYAKYTFYELASNFRSTEINGFIGNIQINYWDKIVSKRADNFRLFKLAYDGNDDFMPIDLPGMDIISSFAMPIICKTKKLAEYYRARFDAAEVEIRPIIAGNIAKQLFYKKHVRTIPNLPNADLVHENGFYFGNNPDMTNKEVATLCGLLVKPETK